MIIKQHKYRTLRGNNTLRYVVETYVFFIEYYVLILEKAHST